MSLAVNILGLDQKVDFADGSVSNVVRIELPNGSLMVALVTEEGAQQILVAVQAAKQVFKERVGGTPQPQVQAPLAPRMVFTPQPTAVPPPQFEFGGEEDAGDDPLDEEDEPVVPPQLGPTLTRVRAPNADEAGNPVDATGRPLYEQGASQEESRTDEDGVRGL